MTVAQRLWIALGVNFAVLVAVVVFHVRAIDRAVSTAHELSEVSARLVLSQARQGSRLALLEETAAKYVVTRDPGYLDKFTQLHEEFAAELADELALPLHAAERGALQRLDSAWVQAGETAAAMSDARSGEVGRLAGWQPSFATLCELSDSVATASQATMRERLARSADESRRAERIAWIAAAAALLLAVITAVALRRAITRPLDVLTGGTRVVARGRFDHRLDERLGGEFAEVATAFNSMTARLGELDRMKRDFVTTVSHDLKSPLASLRETTALLLDEIPGPLAESQRRVLLLQRESADRLGHMIAKLLDLSRLESGVPLVAQHLDVERVLAAAVRQAHAAGSMRSVSVHLSPVPDDARVLLADEDRLRQLLDNLLENAVKFSQPGSDVTVSVQRDGARFVLAVADRGPGVPPEHADRIFERFYQTPAGRAVAGRGAGLGLTICREVVQAHRGRISVLAREGGGSEFRVELPSAEHAGRPLTRSMASSSSDARTRSGRPRGREEAVT